MPNPTHYLLPTERPVIDIRRHWAVLAGTTIQSLLLLVVGVLVARVLDGVDFARLVAIYFCIFVVARWVWKILDWYNEKLVVTDKRVLLLTGIVTRKVAIMPLVKVTDLTYNRSATGLMLGYGQFVVETAGQDQALSTIDFVPKPEKLYLQISELLFGGDKGAPGALVTAAQRDAEEEKERAVRSRWRRFARRRRPAADQPPASPAAPTVSQLDQLLAHRDQLLLADRDDPDVDWEPDGRDYTLDDPDLGALRGTAEPDWDRDDAYRRPEPTVELPRIHEPRRSGDGHRSEAPLPPPRPVQDPPLAGGTDPADD
jgi:membrane protein YdbS with pleckstrin-like domain